VGDFSANLSRSPTCSECLGRMESVTIVMPAKRRRALLWEATRRGIAGRKLTVIAVNAGGSCSSALLLVGLDPDDRVLLLSSL